MMGENFAMSVETALKFYRVCKLYRIDDNDKAARLRIIRKMVARHQAKYIYDLAPYLAGKRVLKIDYKRGPSAH